MLKINSDGFVNSPISALRFARLELGLFTKPSIRMTICEAIDSAHLLLRFICSARLPLQITKKPLGFGEKSHGLLVQNLQDF